METNKSGAIGTEIGVLLYNLRTYLNLSRVTFSQKVGYSRTHIARFESGEAVPSDEVIDKICETFDVNRRYFDINSPMPIEEAVKTKNPAAGVAARLKNTRCEKGLTQGELAKLSGVSQPIISRIEFGEKLTEKQGKKLAEALEVGADWLMFGDEEKRNYPADDKMMKWLWEHEKEREAIWEKIKK